MTFESASFKAMGTEVEVLAAPTLPAQVVEDVRAYFEAVEAALSRFRPDSELSLMNVTAGRPFAASPLMRQVLGEALDAARETGGLFDPLVLHNVEAAGYRESIESVRGAVQVQTAPARTATYADVDIAADGSVLLPAGAGVDLGGFAKGWTVDHAGELMTGCVSWLINAGGDLLTRGAGPAGAGWLMGVEDPFTPGSDLAFLSLSDGAVATSSVMRRRWQTSDGGVAHHLIDPRAGRPSETDLASVTVLAETTARAEVLAKTLLLRGKSEAAAHVAATGLAALLVDNRGLLLISEKMEDYVVV